MPVNINVSTGINTPGLDSAAMPTSGGDPIVESGSNSDGEWTRWADGTQHCSGSVTVPGGSGEPTTTVANYPAVFSQEPRVAATSYAITTSLTRGATLNVSSTTQVEVAVVRSNTNSTENDYIAIGRWK